jgi:hypothetical protein
MIAWGAGVVPAGPGLLVAAAGGGVLLLVAAAGRGVLLLASAGGGVLLLVSAGGGVLLLVSAGGGVLLLVSWAAADAKQNAAIVMMTITLFTCVRIVVHTCPQEPDPSSP